jgi:predicted RNA-binding Zn ribbon-like protein
MAEQRPPTKFDLSGGNLALDFANTVSKRPTLQPIERLTDYRDLVAFGTESGVYPPRAPTRLYAIAREAPLRGQGTLETAIQFREALFGIFSAVAGRRAVPGGALALLNVRLQISAEHGRIVHTGRHFRWEWIGMDSYLDSVLWPIAGTAADLLLSDDLAHLRICGSEECDWLFLDRTKNHRRRWCDMKTCGNRVKARRHYERSRESSLRS